MAGPAFTIENRVGRLLEARVRGLRSSEEADVYSLALGAEVLRVPLHVRPVLLADHRPVSIYPQAAADRLAELFLRMNARLERVAILVARSNATLALQLERIVREAKNPSRRVCYAPGEAEAHLAPIMEPQELARVRAFLEER